MKIEQVKVNFTFQIILLFMLLEYGTVSVSIITIIIIDVLVNYRFFWCIIPLNLFTLNYVDGFF